MTHARPIASGLHAVYDEKGASITRRRRHALTRLQIVRDVYRAFASGDRSLIEQTFADDFTFSSPLDVGLDRAGYFKPLLVRRRAGPAVRFRQDSGIR
jgi:hypothetical protein